ncbi:nitrite reductase NiiA [Eremomyces bilateralis CBS 781.70]|uniref:Nitrite reductase [NAD(P)H] n=1 Tax=Eremomyces bilateralis CBS 781.70 TaxID=1392243 RepID=A0A6G1G835_9PEZI|nr:nitrite reductase NiiA [Eremomyces bilateralis CBS 781.70]KAF1814019.1 nitrite reductase NiiA [Eremomyces bilateralis CBS 781.70]
MTLVREVPLESESRKRVVVVGLGMVGIAFMLVFNYAVTSNTRRSEKLLKLDAKRRVYDVVAIGEEPHLAYNRVGLTSYFQHREIERLYMKSEEWYKSMPSGSLDYHLHTVATDIDTENKRVTTNRGDKVDYHVLIIATGSTAILPRAIPGYNATGVFVYRTIEDLQNLISFSSAKKGQGQKGIVIGGGLLGLEAAKAMLDLEVYEKVTVVEAMPYVLGRQLNSDSGMMVVEQVKNLGVDVVLGKMVSKLTMAIDGTVTGVQFKDGDEIEGTCVCFAIGVRARDDLAKKSGIQCHERGGIRVGDDLQTTAKDVYAIGECANWKNMCYGLVGPGYEMADLLAFNLTEGMTHRKPKSFTEPDMSTKLKLLGIEVASFGDCFADEFGPKWLPDKSSGSDRKDQVKALTYNDPFENIYKKYLFTLDGKYLLGGMMMGDAKDYAKLLAITKQHKQLDTPPGELIIGKPGGDEAIDTLPDDAQICSCNNVTKKDITTAIREGSCKSIGDVKSCTKAGTSCGGCLPLVQTIVNKTMAESGEAIQNHLCPHFKHSRADLFYAVMVKRLESFEAIMSEYGTPSSLGCEVCKPAIASILASLFNKHILDPSRKGLQETNDKFLANIQRNGTFSVVPRVPGGEITPKKLAVIARVAEKYNLYCKITGGQRIDMFGARKQNLLAIWTELIEEGGLESGHAYAKALRTVKSCVGTSWCRFGIGDSVGMAIRIENRYKSIRAPHKIKGAVSGCVRECAEAQNKDFGLVATEKGFNIFVGGNGGAQPRHSELLAKDVPVDDVLPILDRYLSFYIRTADRLQRTARWIEGLPGGIQYLRQVILDDKLGICAELEGQMEELVSSYFCEWTETIKNPERRKQFQQFANVNETVDWVEPITERGQQRPSNWPKESIKADFNIAWSSLSWQPLVEASKFQDLPTGDSQQVKRGGTQLAIFKVRGKYYSTQQMCPHKRAFVLSDGLIGEGDNKLWVSCPHHKRNFELSGPEAGKCGNDDMNISTFAAEEREDGWIYVQLPPVDELDRALGTERWKVRAGQTPGQLDKLDDILKMKTGRKGERIVANLRASAACIPNGHDTLDW